MKPNPVQPFVSVLLHKDGNSWVAQCLEKDLAVQGPTVEEAKNRFLRTLTAQITDDLLDGHEPLSTLAQAPKHFFDCLGDVKASGPELPVYVPAGPNATDCVTTPMTARFFEKAA